MRKVCPNTIRNEQFTPLNLSAEEIKVRRKNLHEIVNNLYPNLKVLTNQEYERIKQEYNSGNRSVVPELLEKSLSVIFSSVVCIYAKYDFSKLDFEDALSIAYAHSCELLTRSDKKVLSEKRIQYFGVLNLNIRLYLSRYYQTMLRHNIHLAVDNCESITEIKEDISFDEIFNDIKKEYIIKLIIQRKEEMGINGQEIFRMSFLQRKKDVEVAKALNLNVSRVRYYKQKIKKLLQDSLKANKIDQEDYLL